MGHGGMHVVASVNNLSVTRTPIDAVVDGGDHFGFNLAHVRKKREGMESGRGAVPLPCSQYRAKPVRTQ